MKKITKIIMLMIVSVIIFAGCSTVEYTTVINSDGSAKLTYVMDIDKAKLDESIKKMGYSNPEQYVKSEMDGDYYEIVTIEGKQYYEVRDVELATAKNFSEYAGYAGGISKDGLYVTKDTVFGTINSAKGDFEDYADQMKICGYTLGNAISMKLVYEFPSDIVSTNGTIDPTNSKKVTFNIDITKKTTIFATTNKANTYKAIKAKVDKWNTVKKPVIKSLKVKDLKKKKATATLKIKKVKDAKYYVEYSTSKKFKYSKTSYKSSKKQTIVLKNLKPGKKYYVRVMIYKENYASKMVYSKYTKTTFKVPKK